MQPGWYKRQKQKHSALIATKLYDRHYMQPSIRSRMPVAPSRTKKRIPLCPLTLKLENAAPDYNVKATQLCGIRNGDGGSGCN